MYRFTRREWMAASAGAAARPPTTHPVVEIAGRRYDCPNPHNRFDWGSVEWRVEGAAYRITLDAPPNARLRVPHGIAYQKALLPARNGLLKEGSRAAYELAGGHSVENPQALAIPMIDAEAGARRFVLCADPAHTTAFLPGEFEWVHTAGGRAERTFYILPHPGNFRDAMDVFYRTALAGVKPGPDWLHDVAMVDYDYLSKNGRGWFADIDKLAELIPPPDRRRVVMTLHGWYDLVGRYAYDWRTRRLESRWTAFPNVNDPGFVAHANHPERMKQKLWGWKRTFGRMKPSEMTIREMHRRIRYAKDKGFRCVLYFADGMNSGDGIADVHDPSKVLRWGGWIGPETKGKTYVQNPLHPDVREFYNGYMSALLDEYGKEIDGLVWDETFTVHAGDRGAAPYPGYADAAMMALVGELRRKVEAFSPRLALLSSDNLGPNFKAPYALAAHGNYQDSGCRPNYWPFGLLPNFRNVLWSCNWFPDTTWEWNERAVDPFGAPVAISNGYGDDLGIAEMNAGQVRRTLALFRKRAARRTRIGWVEQQADKHMYAGKEIPL